MESYVLNQLENSLKIKFSKPQILNLKTYVRHLKKWSQRVRLISKGDRSFIWERHIMDSLSVLPFILDTGCLLDFGSGGGLPGIPIAIMKPDLRIDLLEATRMKCLFLKEMVKVLELNSVAVIHSRSENLVIQPKYKQRYGRITARAVAPLPSLWASTCELLSTDGKLIAFKGPEYESEKSVPVESGIELKVQEVKLPIIEGKRVFVMVNHVSRET